MTNNQLTEEELQTLIIELQQTAYRLNGTNSAYLMSDAIKPLRELQERRETEMDSEPVAWDYEWASCITCEGPQDFKRIIEREAPPEWAIEEGQARNIIPLYRHAQPAMAIESDPVFTLEVSRADYKGQKLGNHFGFITLDAARELKEGNYQLYTAQPAPVVVDERAAFNAWNNEDNLPIAGVGAKNAAWLAWQARAKLAGNSPVIPEGYVMVPVDLLSELRDLAHPEIEKYCEMWEGRRDDEFPALRKIIADADALLAADDCSIPMISDRWIPVSERMPENKPGSYEYLVFEKLNNRVNHDYWNVPDAGDDTFTPFWNYYGEYVTHWMPLPAAPQEVKGD
ncbi:MULTISPECIES: DUF551 domain-containing protein [Klebsiella]|uniref:DUF551 domain-containing protein n=1 Tax=Klebsiella TaxID=570 RepID=UPI000DBB3A46|nr:MULTISPECIES: DUF551 domain-containing protein [Klebsiella]MDZ1043014.1 DUF551 domain-containing protein [Klebsiella pneumoniae]MDZ1587287.1 DUF551 domain-containing protein [Klebsiella pneumoniae]MDZ3806138.1 DUF551 domain-containing protein [Klebsiella pneumoniae]BBE03178.1 hypothetical protein KPGSU103_C18960 [Klebsiella pneumoniae]